MLWHPCLLNNMYSFDFRVDQSIFCEERKLFFFLHEKGKKYIFFFSLCIWNGIFFRYPKLSTFKMMLEYAIFFFFFIEKKEKCIFKWNTRLRSNWKYDVQSVFVAKEVTKMSKLERNSNFYKFKTFLTLRIKWKF